NVVWSGGGGRVVAAAGRGQACAGKEGRSADETTDKKRFGQGLHQAWASARAAPTRTRPGPSGPTSARERAA
ncbi:MAG TPA: hypothetical protein VM487_13330, partial [Phycisphaerae bacterium]|nr:hypothetical protein [Phycisphaerae bacterium]